MRILLMTDLYPPAASGGYEAECAGIAEHLSAAHEVVVLTSRVRRRELERSGRVRRELPLARRVKREALYAPMTAALAARRTRRALERFAPDVVYVWNGSRIPHAALRAVELSPVPVAYRVCEHWFGLLHTGDPFMRYLVGDERGLRAPWSKAIRTANRLLPDLRLGADRVPVAISWNSDALRRLTPLPANIEPVLERTIHPATPDDARLRSLARRPSSKPTVLFLGRLKPSKGPDIAIRALAALPPAHRRETRLIVAGQGTGAMRRTLQQVARDAGVEQQVELVGQQDRSAVAALLATAHAVVVPSRWQEPFGLVCLEAALARAPVVAARSGGLPEILAEEREALFFEINDVAGCARALARTLEDPAGSRRRAAEAFSRACQLSFPRYLDETERLLHDVVSCAALAPADQRFAATSR